MGFSYVFVQIYKSCSWWKKIFIFIIYYYFFALLGSELYMKKETWLNN